MDKAAVETCEFILFVSCDKKIWAIPLLGVDLH